MLRVAIPSFALVINAVVPLGAQAVAGDSGSVRYFHSQYVADLSELHRKIAALAEAIPTDKYSWRPAPGVRSVSEVLMHVAGEWYSFCAMSVAAKPPAEFTPPGPAMKKLEEVTAKVEVMSHLEKSWTTCNTAITAASPSQLVPEALPAKMPFARVALLVSGDQHEHLGQLIAYARMVGVVPPWSK